MLGFSSFSALLPEFSKQWALTSTQGGIISSALFVGYTIAVPFLVSLADRVDARKIYLASVLTGGIAHWGFGVFADDVITAALFRALYGISLAGTYMPGLHIIGTHLPPATVARATGFYTATFGLGTAASYILSDTIAASLGLQAVFFIAAVTSVLAAGVMIFTAHPCKPHSQAGPWLATLDPLPVFRNKSVMGYSICYALHSYELFTVRSWLVAFLSMAVISGGSAAGYAAPAIVAAVMTLAGVFASIGGNEIAIRTGRRRAITFAMVISGVVALAVAGS